MYTLAHNCVATTPPAQLGALGRTEQRFAWLKALIRHIESKSVRALLSPPLENSRSNNRPTPSWSERSPGCANLLFESRRVQEHLGPPSSNTHECLEF